MADEAEQGGGGGGGGGGSVLKKYGPLAAIVLLAQVVLAWVVINVTVGDKMGKREEDEDLLSQAQTVAERQEAQETGELPYYFTDPALQGITANPAGTNAQRYAVLSVELGLVGEDDGKPIPADELPTDEALVAQVPKYMGLVKSIVLTKLRSSYIDDLENNLGTIMDELRDELNQQVLDRVKWDEDGKKKVRIKEIRVTGLVIQ